MDDETKYYPSNEKKAREDFLKKKIPLIKPLQFLIIKYETIHPEYSKEYLKNEKGFWNMYRDGNSCTIKQAQIILKRRVIYQNSPYLCLKFYFLKNLRNDSKYMKYCKKYNCDQNINCIERSWFGH
jgi:hypothetical protein